MDVNLAADLLRLVDDVQDNATKLVVVTLADEIESPVCCGHAPASQRRILGVILAVMDDAVGESDPAPVTSPTCGCDRPQQGCLSRGSCLVNCLPLVDGEILGRAFDALRHDGVYQGRCLSWHMGIGADGRILFWGHRIRDGRIDDPSAVVLADGLVGESVGLSRAGRGHFV